MTAIIALSATMRDDSNIGTVVAWDSPATVEAFVRSPANHMLLQDAARMWRDDRRVRVLDVGCGAGRNAVPLARRGCLVIGTDLSQPILQAAAALDADDQLRLVEAPMDALPLGSRNSDLIVAYCVWNLATSGAEFRRART